MIYGIRNYDGKMLRFFGTEEGARDFVRGQSYDPTCYSVEPYSELDFANFVLESLHNVDAVLSAHRLFGGTRHG